jgi:hypothetical protein
MHTKTLPDGRRRRYADNMTEKETIALSGRAHELMRNNAFMRDFFAVTTKEITAADLREKHGVTSDEVRSIVQLVRAQRNGTIHERSPKSAARKKPGKQRDVKTPTPSFADDVELVEDLCRYSESVLTEAQVRKRHKLTESDLLAMGEDDDLVRKIDDRKIRRVRDGSCKRELAALHVVRGPQVLANILDDPSTHAKHKVDAIKTLDHLATPPGQVGAADSSRFVIQINLGSDANGREIIETYDKPRAIGVSDDNTIIDVSNSDGR